jgi:cell shape-determining protein MreC
MQKWIGQIDAQTAAASDKAQKLQTQIQQNETAITQAKLDKNDSKAKSLQKENKKLWDDFNAAKKELSTICANFTKEASGRVKQYAEASGKALEALKSQPK